MHVMETLLWTTLIQSGPGVVGGIVAVLVWLNIKPTLRAMQAELVEFKADRVNCQHERKKVEDDLHRRITVVVEKAAELKGRVNGRTTV